MQAPAGQLTRLERCARARMELDRQSADRDTPPESCDTFKGRV